MPVDVQCEIEISRPRDEIAAYACDPDNAIEWYRNITAVEWITPKPLAVGSRIASASDRGASFSQDCFTKGCGHSRGSAVPHRRATRPASAAPSGRWLMTGDAVAVC